MMNFRRARAAFFALVCLLWTILPASALAEPSDTAVPATADPATVAPTVETTPLAPTLLLSEPTTEVPTTAPTNETTNAPTNAPTDVPTNAPTNVPTDAPTNAPTESPTDAPTLPPYTDADIEAYLQTLSQARTFAGYLGALEEQLAQYEQGDLLPKLTQELENGRYRQFENAVQDSLRAEIVRQLESGAASDEAILSYYEARRKADILTFISELTDGSAELGALVWSQNQPSIGTTVTVAVPLVFTPTSGQNALYSNAMGGALTRYPNAFARYDDNLCSYLSFARVQLDTSAADFPFETPDDNSYTVIGKVADNYLKWGLTYDPETGLYSGLAGDELVNCGYAVFNLTVKSSLYTGSYPLTFNVYWTNARTGKSSVTEVSTTVSIKGKSQYTGGGGGGGVSAAATASPTTKLYVESITTDPERVSAGESFDLVLAIRNTSEKKYVQNMKVTISAADDALLPISGSNTVYIDRIDADSVYELRFPVRAKLDLESELLKVDVGIEYEDQSVTALSANQTMTIEVAQVQRLTVSDPSVGADTPVAGGDYEVTVQVVNEGRTTLYNVTVTASSDNESLLSVMPYYVGNMDGGSSHKAKFDLVPLAEGLYDVNFDVTYESASGEVFSASSTAVSFYATPAETYDYNQDYDYDALPEETAPAVDALSVMRRLPWWLYAAVGALFVSVMSFAALGARARHRKALIDDEMD